MGKCARILEPERSLLEPAGIVVNRRRKGLNRWLDRLNQVQGGNDRSFGQTTGRFARTAVVLLNDVSLTSSSSLGRVGARVEARGMILEAREGA